MKNIIFIVLVLISSSVLSFEKNVLHSLATNYLEQIDKELDYAILMGKRNIFDIEAYFKLIAVRSMLEGNSHDSFDGEATSLYVVSAEIKKVVENKVRFHALAFQRLYFQEQINEKVYYPSIEKAGNVIGYKFPEKTWVLTFDDGPRKNSTEKIVDELSRFNFKATFFALTNKIERFSSTMEYVLDSGMELALHSYTHPNLNKSSDHTLDYEISTAKNKMEELSGEEIRFFRLPFGSGVHNTKIRQKIKDENLLHIFWNVDSLDWKDKNPQSVLERVKKQMALSPNNSGVILFHDIHKKTIESSSLVMEYLSVEDYNVCPLGEVIDYMNFGTEAQNCDL